MPVDVVKDTFRSPRAHKDYDHRRKPVPKYLEDSLHNSFPTNQLLIPFLNAVRWARKIQGKRLGAPFTKE